MLVLSFSYTANKGSGLKWSGPKTRGNKMELEDQGIDDRLR